MRALNATRYSRVYHEIMLHYERRTYVSDTKFDGCFQYFHFKASVFTNMTGGARVDAPFNGRSPLQSAQTSNMTSAEYEQYISSALGLNIDNGNSGLGNSVGEKSHTTAIASSESYSTLGSSNGSIDNTALLLSAFSGTERQQQWGTGYSTTANEIATNTSTYPQASSHALNNPGFSSGYHTNFDPNSLALFDVTMEKGAENESAPEKKLWSRMESDKSPVM